MIKLNRIGNKLGVVGAVGVLLAIGMIANQWMTESSVSEVNKLADVQQSMVENVLAAEVSVQQIQLAGRNIRLQRTPAEVEQTAVEMRKFKGIAEKQIDDARVVSKNPVNIERLNKITAAIANYTAGIEDLAKVQSEIFVKTDKRTEISSEWATVFAAQLQSPALVELTNRQEVEMLLQQADSKINALRAAAWRLSSMGMRARNRLSPVPAPPSTNTLPASGASPARRRFETASTRSNRLSRASPPPTMRS